MAARDGREEPSASSRCSISWMRNCGRGSRMEVSDAAEPGRGVRSQSAGRGSRHARNAWARWADTACDGPSSPRQTAPRRAHFGSRPRKRGASPVRGRD
eukprot:scaffold95368_cov28-Tisochrysis_lutea.AAC.2